MSPDRFGFLLLAIVCASPPLDLVVIRQEHIRVGPFLRGYHLITNEVLSAWGGRSLPVATGFCQIFLRHTSASLTINENADPTVRQDFESTLNKLVPENAPWYRHTLEGPDDMPAHIKSSLLGCELMIPVRDGRLGLGTWQGIYLCEHRDRAGQRELILTLFGEPAA